MHAVQPHSFQPVLHLSHGGSSKTRSCSRATQLIVIDAAASISQPIIDRWNKEAIALSISPEDLAIPAITSALHQHPNIDFVHIMARCEAGNLWVGSTMLSETTIEQYGWDFQDWFSHHYRQVPVRRPQIHIDCSTSDDSIFKRKKGVLSLVPPILKLLSQLTGADVSIS